MIDNPEFKKPLVIAIDGHSGCGKSTIARDLAKTLGFTYIDTGAMYRAVTLLMIRNKIELTDESRIISLLDKIDMEFKFVEDRQALFVNGENVENAIRRPEIANMVSPVSIISSIRKKMVEIQRKMAEGHQVILEGRDIGTVVFPNADIKFFITADLEIRAKRRHRQLKAKKTPAPIEYVRKNLAERDRIDSSREDSPLSKAADAILIDTTDQTRESQLELVAKHVKRLSAAKIENQV